MNKNTKSTTKSTVKNNVTKTAAPKTKLKKSSPTREAYKILTDELKRLSSEKKGRKSEMLKKIDAMWKEYQTYTKDVYKTARKAAIDKFNAVKAAAKTENAKKPTKKTPTKSEQKTEQKSVPAVDEVKNETK